MRTRKTRLEFGKIADLWSSESAPGHLGREDTLMELLSALWRGEFEDEDGSNSCLQIHPLEPGGAEFIADNFGDEYNA